MGLFVVFRRKIIVIQALSLLCATGDSKRLEPAYIARIKKLLAIIGKSAPFLPNISGISSAIQISRQTLLQYFQYLEDAKLIFRVFKGPAVSERLESQTKYSSKIQT